MTRDALRTQAQAIATAAARLMAKAQIAVEMLDAGKDLDAIGIVFGEAEKVADEAVVRASRAFDETAQLRADEWDAAWNKRAIEPEDFVTVAEAIGTITALHAAHFDRPSAQIIPLYPKPLALVSESNGAA
jgi:hypothetical protein